MVYYKSKKGKESGCGNKLSYSLAKCGEWILNDNKPCFQIYCDKCMEEKNI